MSVELRLKAACVYTMRIKKKVLVFLRIKQERLYAFRDRLWDDAHGGGGSA